MKLDIEKIKNIKKDLAELNGEDVLFVENKGVTEYVIMDIGQYEQIEDIANLVQQTNKNDGIIISNNTEPLTYDEYKMIKKKINEVIDNNFKPKPEKLN